MRDGYGMNIHPSGNSVIVRIPLPSEKKGSLFVPIEVIEREQDYSVFAQVMAVGPDAFKGLISGSNEFGHIRAKVGDWIVMPRQAGLKIIPGSARNGKHKNSFVCIMDADILCVVDKPEDTDLVFVVNRLVGIAKPELLSPEEAHGYLYDESSMFYDELSHIEDVETILKERAADLGKGENNGVE